MGETSRAGGPSDMYGWRARIGYTSPPLTTEVFPYEFYKLAPPGVSLVLTTLAIVVRSKDEIDLSYDISMKAAREMAAAKCDAIILGGVPINLSRGASNAQTLIQELEAEFGVKVSSSAAAQRRAAELLGVRKCVVAHPYSGADTERISGYSAHFGAQVLGAKAWGSPFNQIGRVPRDAALTLGRQLLREHPGADAIIFPSPHWPTLEALDALEEEFGVAALSALQMIVWHALRLCGIDDRIDGFGRLLREF